MLEHHSSGNVLIVELKVCLRVTGLMLTLNHMIFFMVLHSTLALIFEKHTQPDWLHKC
jgi:hypothetical protein